MVRNPSAWANEETEPEPLPEGKAFSPSVAIGQGDHDEFGPAEVGQDAHRRRGVDAIFRAAAASPLIARSTGATKSWKVNIAEVGNPAG